MGSRGLRRRYVLGFGKGGGVWTCADGLCGQYVATRMNLKGQQTVTESAPGEGVSEEEKKAVDATEDPVVAKEAGVGAEA